MAKFLFCNIPYFGHVNPTLPIVRELTTQGAEVIYYCTDKFKSEIEAAGATFRPYISPQMVDPQQRGQGFSDDELINNTHFILQQVIDDARTMQANCLVYEAMCLWGKVLARILRLPAVSLATSLATNKYFHPFDTYTRTTEPRPFSLKMLETIKKLCTTYGIPLFNYEAFFFHDERLNIVFFPREFHPAVETFSKRFLFVGPSIVPSQNTSNFPLDQIRERHAIYVSLGTVENNVPAFYDLCLHAFSGRTQTLVMSTGETIDPEIFGPLPENVLLYKYVPQIEVLQYTDIFINHSGANSAMEALYFGIPTVMVPITHEQTILARRCQDLKLGVTIENMKRVTTHTLRLLVDRLRDDPEILVSVQRMREIIHHSGGYKQAANAILQLEV